jgi:hypothetical protein
MNSKTDNKVAEEAAVDAARAFIDAFNAQDYEWLATTLNFPHVRLALGKFVTTPSAEKFAAAGERVSAALKKEGWHHTVLRNISVIHSGPDKVHMKLDIDRCHADGSVYNQFDTLWIATLCDGHWGIAFRSSYLR